MILWRIKDVGIKVLCCYTLDRCACGMSLTTNYEPKTGVEEIKTLPQAAYYSIQNALGTYMYVKVQYDLVGGRLWMLGLTSFQGLPAYCLK